MNRPGAPGCAATVLVAAAPGVTTREKNAVARGAAAWRAPVFWRLAAAVLGLLFLGPWGADALRAAAPAPLAPAPVITQSAPGRFEIAAVETAASREVTGAAVEVWDYLSAPLALPDAFPTPVFVRLIPGADWTERAAFRVIVEAGGVVSVRIGWRENLPPAVVPRALVQALLMRLAVAQHGVNARLAAPLWLELGCVAWCRTRADAAHYDALKQASGALAPPALAELLTWPRGGDEPRELAVGGFWLLTFLQAESTRAGEWPAWLRRVLAGDEPLAALEAGYAGRFRDATQRELWWQTGWHHVRRVHALPLLSTAESRAALEALQRFVASTGADDTVIPLASVGGFARAPWIAGELKRRAADIARVLPSLHPFYRNAALSLADCLAHATAAPAERAATLAAFESDWRDAMELEAATTAALDAWEKKRRP